MSSRYEIFESALHELVESESARAEAQSDPETFAEKRGLTTDQMKILGNEGVARELNYPKLVSPTMYCGCCCVID